MYDSFISLILALSTLLLLQAASAAPTVSKEPLPLIKRQCPPGTVPSPPPQQQCATSASAYNMACYGNFVSCFALPVLAPATLPAVAPPTLPALPPTPAAAPLPAPPTLPGLPDLSQLTANFALPALPGLPELPGLSAPDNDEE